MVFGLSGTLPVSAVCCFPIPVLERRSTVALHSAPALILKILKQCQIHFAAVEPAPDSDALCYVMG